MKIPILVLECAFNSRPEKAYYLGIFFSDGLFILLYFQYRLINTNPQEANFVLSSDHALESFCFAKIIIKSKQIVL